MKRRSIESENENQLEYNVDYIDTESDKDEDREYTVDYIDTESDEEDTNNKEKDSDAEDDSGNVDSDNISSETDNGGDSSGDGDANLEPRVTLGEMIADLDNCEPGTLFLNILEMYALFIVTLYMFAIIASS